MTTAFRDIFLSAVWYFNGLVLTLLIVQSFIYSWQLGTAYLESRSAQHSALSTKTSWLLAGDFTFPISILVPAYNEQATLEQNIRSLLALHYPDFEVIVVNDGSKDRTLQAVIEAFDLKPADRAYQQAVPHKPILGIYGNPRYPRLLVVDKENGGRSDALNAALDLARCPLFCEVDADSMLDSEALLLAVRPFIQEPERMIAVGGQIRIVNGCEVRNGRVIKAKLPASLLPLLQVVEYTRSFVMARLSWSRMQSIMIVSGAFGLFKRPAAIRVGGFSQNTVGEDMELVVKLHRYYRENGIPYAMRYLPDPVCWTEAPSTLRSLRSQRTRWQRGMLEVLVKHRRMIFSPRYGVPGVVGMGYFFIFDALGPIVEAIGHVVVPLCWLAGILNLSFFLAYLSLTCVFGVFISVGALFLEEISGNQVARARDLAILTFCAVIENLGYRQLNNFWRIQGLWQFLRKKKGWGDMARTGFQVRQAKPDATKVSSAP